MWYTVYAFLFLSRFCHVEKLRIFFFQVKGGKFYEAIVEDTCRWKVLLEPESNPGPFIIQALSETETLTLNDVMFGDVWLCSGQSNMVFTLNMVCAVYKQLSISLDIFENEIMSLRRHAGCKPSVLFFYLHLFYLNK